MDKKYCPYCMSPVEEDGNCSVCGLTEGSYVPSPHHLPPGTVLMDRYLVGRVLGEGGFGITYIGCDLRLEMKAAIKEYYPLDRATRNASASLEISSFIGPSAASYERGKQKFLSEAQVMARMDKQQVIVNVRDFFEVNNTAYIVMEYIEGITFHELVEKKGGRIMPQELFPMIEPLFLALSAIHDNGLIHRDISPDNLMLENGRVRLLDFGCAREASRGTETMTIALKHGYAPIEQYQQKGQGPWTDVYALSATIYYCLTGRVPPQALDRIAEDELLLPCKLGVGLTERQEQALLKGMRLQPNRRYSNVKELWAALYTEPVQEQNAGRPAASEYSLGHKALLESEALEQSLGQEVSLEFEALEQIGQEALLESKAPEQNIGQEAFLESRASEQNIGQEASLESRASGQNIGQEALLESEAPGYSCAHRTDVQESGAFKAQESAAGLDRNMPQESAQAASGMQPAPSFAESYAQTDAGSDTAHGAAGLGRKIVIAAGIAAACCLALVILGAGIYRLRIYQAGGNVTGGVSAVDSAAAGSGTQTGGSDMHESWPKPAEGVYVPSENEFKAAYGAYVFSNGTAEEFRRLMEASSVSTVIMDGDAYSMMTDICITKPVLLKEHAKLQADRLTIAEGGYLLVEGTLDMSASGYVRLEGSDTCLYIAQGGRFEAQDAFVWMDDEHCFYMQSGEELSTPHLVFLGGELEDAVSVTDAQTLIRAAQQGRRIRIDADIIMTEEVSFTAPVQISKGASVHMVQVESNQETLHFCLEEGAVFVNYGTLTGDLFVCGGAVAVNYGSFAGKASGMKPDISLWIEGEGSTLVNFGTVTARDVSRFWKGSLCVNMGNMRAQDLYLAGGNMVNYGDIIVPKQKPDSQNASVFTIEQGSMLWNKKDARVTVGNGAEFNNYSKINNRKGGSICIKSDGIFRNAVFENNGEFQAQTGAWLDDQRHGIYYGEGMFDIGDANIKVHHVPATDAGYPEDEGTAAVQNEEELSAALKDADTQAVWITKDITVQKDITVTKTLFVDGALAMADDAKLTGDGAHIVLMPDASLQADDIMLQQDAQIYMQDASSLMVGRGGTLALDSAFLWGSGDIRLDNAKFILDNQSAFALSAALSGTGSLEAGQCEIRIQNHSSFATVYGRGLRLDGAVVTMHDSQPESAASNFCCVSDMQLVDCTLELDSGMFSGASDVKLVNGEAVIGADAQFQTYESNLSVLGNAEVTIWGLAEIGGWDEYIFTVHSKITNYGELFIGIKMDAAEKIDNQGTVRIGKDVDASCIIGNAPKIDE